MIPSGIGEHILQNVLCCLTPTLRLLAVTFETGVNALDIGDRLLLDAEVIAYKGAYIVIGIFSISFQYFV